MAKSRLHLHLPILEFVQHWQQPHLAQLVNDLLLGGITASLEQLLNFQEGREELCANLAGVCCCAIQMGGGDVQQRLQMALQSRPLCL